MKSIALAFIALLTPPACVVVGDFTHETCEPGLTLKPRVELAVAKHPESRALFTQISREVHDIARTRNVIDGRVFASGLVMLEGDANPETDAALYEFARLLTNTYDTHGPRSGRTFIILEAVAVSIDEALRGPSPSTQPEHF